jgi:hypothetical protein
VEPITHLHNREPISKSMKRDGLEQGRKTDDDESKTRNGNFYGEKRRRESHWFEPNVNKPLYSYIRYTIAIRYLREKLRDR